MLDACTREGFLYVDLGAIELSIRQTLTYARILLTPRGIFMSCVVSGRVGSKLLRRMMMGERVIIGLPKRKY